MLQRLFALIVLLPLWGFTAAQAQEASGATLLDTSGAWSAYKYTDEQGGLVCFIASKPREMEGNYQLRGEVWLQITHRQNPTAAANKTNVVSFIAGFRFFEDFQPILQVGTERFRMHTQDESAWSFPGDDATLTRALRDGNEITIESKSWRGTEIRDTFLAGVTAMHNLISQECGVSAL